MEQILNDESFKVILSSVFNRVGSMDEKSVRSLAENPLEMTKLVSSIVSEPCLIGSGATSSKYPIHVSARELALGSTRVFSIPLSPDTPDAISFHLHIPPGAPEGYRVTFPRVELCGGFDVVFEVHLDSGQGNFSPNTLEPRFARNKHRAQDLETVVPISLADAASLEHDIMLPNGMVVCIDSKSDPVWGVRDTVVVRGGGLPVYYGKSSVSVDYSVVQSPHGFEIGYSNPSLGDVLYGDLLIRYEIKETAHDQALVPAIITGIPKLLLAPRPDSRKVKIQHRQSSRSLC
jgi:hypothetical protein